MVDLEHVAGVLLYELVVRGVEQRPEAAVVEHPGAAAERAEDAAEQAVVGVLAAGGRGGLDRLGRERLRLPGQAELLGDRRPDQLGAGSVQLEEGDDRLGHQGSIPTSLATAEMRRARISSRISANRFSVRG